MKKQFLLVAASLFACNSMIFSQTELVAGGNMEDDSYWTGWADGGAVDSTVVTADFNVTSDRPTGGSGGCLEITGYGQTSYFMYQKVKIVPGTKYLLDGLVKNISVDALTNTWVDLQLTRIKPAYKTPDDSAGFVYKKDSWMAEPYNSYDNMDGDFFSYSQFLYTKVLDGQDSILTSKEFTVPATETNTDWYVVIKIGCWNAAGNSTPTFDFLFDNISLKDVNGTNVAQKSVENSSLIFPNPSTGIVNIKSGIATKYEIYNVAGSLVKSGKLESSVLNLSSLEKGTYVLKLDSNTSADYQKLILK